MTLEWIKAAGIRALKTFAQTFAAFITIGGAFEDIDWLRALSVAGVALIYSLVTSLKGLPELTTNGVIQINTTDPNKDVYRLVLDEDMESLIKRSTVTLRVEK